MSTEGIDTLDYLTDEQLRRQFSDNEERYLEQQLALRRTANRSTRIYNAMQARGIA